MLTFFKHLTFKSRAPLPASILFDQKKMTEWIESLDLTQPYYAAQLIREKCETFLEVPELNPSIVYPQALKSIFLLDAALLSVISSLHCRYIQAIQEYNVQHENDFLIQLEQLIQATLKVYEYLNEQLKKYADPWEVYTTQAELITRLTFFYSQAMRVYRYRHENIPPLLWKKLHDTYKLAYYKNWLNHPSLQSFLPTIKEAYIHTLLIAALDTGGYSSDLYPYIDQLLSEAHEIELSPIEHEEKTGPSWWIDLKSDRGLQRVQNAPAGEYAKPNCWLDCSRLIHTLCEKKQNLNLRLNTEHELNKQSELTTRLNLIDKLCRDWSVVVAPISRVEERRIQLESVQWFSGIDVIRTTLHPDILNKNNHKLATTQEELMSQLFSRGQSPFSVSTKEQVSDPGYLKDFTSKGCALRVKFQSENVLSVGTLIVYRRQHQKQWYMGVIRRIRKILRTEIEVGIEHLGESWSGIDYFSSFASNQVENVLYFPLNYRNPKFPNALLMSLHTYESAITSPLIRLGQTLYPITFTAILEKTRGWALLGFDLLPAVQ